MSLFRCWSRPHRVVSAGNARDYLLAVGLFAIALTGRFGLASTLPPSGFPFLTFFPAVLLATYFGGLGPGLVTGTLSVVAAWYFFIDPYGSFVLLTASDEIALIFFAAIIAVDIFVIHRMNSAVGRLAEEQRRSARLADELQRLNTSLEERVLVEVASRESAHLKLAQDQRLQVLGTLAGGVAHDFNNVLQAVQSGANLIRRRAASPDAVLHISQMLEEAAQRGASITSRLLTFARRSEMRSEPVDPGGLVRGLREIFCHTLGTHIEIRIDVEHELPMLITDRGQLETVLVNLATNARDAMPRGGVLTISVAAESLSQDSATEFSLKSGLYVKFTVQDTGEGMAPEVLRRAEEPFFTTKGVGIGTGLGLAMAKGFAEQAAGALVIDSTLGVGTTITIRLPAAPPETIKEQRHSITPVAPPRLRILLVDDDTLVRNFLAESLSDQGFYVVPAGSGAGALALLAAEEQPDVLVTDYEMPGMDGLSLLDAVRASTAFKRLPAILLTGKIEQALELISSRRAITDPLLRVMRKPVKIEELASELGALDRARREEQLSE
jgi:signal transduction histidine kinase/CheY-like chemotaxis protein